MPTDRLSENLRGQQGSYILPFIWYSGESRELLGREIRAVSDSGAREFVLENRGGNWFATEFWWEIFGFALETAEKLHMRVWCLDDSHVNTGSANDSLSREENARFRAKNYRMEMIDAVGPLVSGAVSLPNRTAAEKIVRITAFELDENTGRTGGPGIDLTGNIVDGLCAVDLPAGLWRIYFILTADPEKNGLFRNYITMVSRDSCRHLIDEVHEKFYARYSKYFGSTFAGFFSDEPAFGNCDGQYGPHAYDLRLGQPEKMFPWWDDFPERLGEKLDLPPEKVMELLPALWDDMEGVSPRFRLAYMDLVTGLWRENFSCQIGRWCEAHGVEYIGHNLEDNGAHMRTGWGCGHYFRSMSGQHMSGMDLVFDQLIPGISRFPHAMNNGSRKRESAFYHYALPKMAASLAHITPGMKNRALAEVFGAMGWTCGASLMRAVFNTCQACGVTHFIPHAFSMALPEVFQTRHERSALEGSYTPPGYCLTYLPPTFHAGGFNPQFRVFGEIVRCAQRVSHLTAGGTHQADLAVCYNAECDWMNDGAYQDLSEVAMKLTRAGYDYDILPLDTIAGSASAEEGKLAVNGERFGALVVPGGEIMPEKLLAACRGFAAAGVPVYITGIFPERTENGAPDTSGLRYAELDGLCGELRRILPPRFRVREWHPDLRYYVFRDADGNGMTLLYNSGIREIAVSFDAPCVIYDPWTNRAYRLKSGGPLTLQSFQLLVRCDDREPAGLPEFPLPPRHWESCVPEYRISIREAGQESFRVLRERSRAVDLLREEKLSRCCAEFRYETGFEYAGSGASVLELPGDVDAAELILNGENCGMAVGPVCRFDIAGKLKEGRNSLEIHTFDTPAFADRKGDAYIGWGAWAPLRQHGFTGDIRIGRS